MMILNTTALKNTYKRKFQEFPTFITKYYYYRIYSLLNSTRNKNEFPVKLEIDLYTFYY